MGQDDLRCAALRQNGGKAGGVLIAEMALGAQNPLFQIVGIGPAAEGLDVMVGLQHRQIHALQDVGGLVGDVAGIRQHAHSAVAGVQPEAAGAGGVMGCGKCRHGKLRAALEQRLQAGDVVRVGVGDEDGRKASGFQAQLPQSGGDASAGDACIQQNIALPAGEQQRVPGGTACQRMYGGQKTYLFR